MIAKNEASKYGKVAVLMGGDNCEREVSLVSGESVLKALLELGIDAHRVEPTCENLLALKPLNYDRVFNALHGAKYEDGALQGFLQTIGLPSTGPDLLCSAICMNKIFSKFLWKHHGLPVVPFHQINRVEDIAIAAEKFGLPLCVKPNDQGSSKGVTKVKTAEQFESAFKVAYQHGSNVIAEPWITGREIAVGVCDDEVASIVEIIPQGEFYDYNAKYVDDTEFPCPCDLPAEQTKAVKALAIEAAAALKCAGVVRVDMIIDQQNQPWLIEVNTLPGMTSHSLLPRSFGDCGYDFKQLIIKILDRTLES